MGSMVLSLVVTQSMFRSLGFCNHVGENSYQGDILMKKEKKCRKFGEKRQKLGSLCFFILHIPVVFQPNLT